MKKQWKILLVLLMIVLAAAGYGLYLFNAKPADVRTIEADYSLSATNLMDDFNKDEAAANLKYLNKVISVKGKVSDIKLEQSTGQATIILDSGDPIASITCSFYADEAGSVKQIKEGEEIVVKGKCTGKLTDIILNKCSIEK
ncbi:MAG: hypothetical protein ABI472_22190 [Ginsengibacter sp.]